MHIVTTLRGRLIAMVAALVAVTLGSAAIISTRVAHYEIRKFEVDVHGGRKPLAISDYYRTHRTHLQIRPAPTSRFSTITTAWSEHRKRCTARRSISAQTEC